MANKLQSYMGASALGLALMLGPQQAESAIVVTLNPNEVGGNVQLRVNATNNDEGAIYNTGEWNIFQDLFAGMYALPVNSDTTNHPSTAYSSLEDFIASANIAVTSTAPSNVYNGWSVTKNSDGSIETVNIGIPGNYDLWRDNITAPNQSTQGIVLNVPLDKLAISFDENNLATDWATIVLSSQTMPNAFVGNTGINSYQTEGNFYQVQVPEPSTYAAIFGLLAGAGVMLRRRQKNKVAESSK